MEIEVNIYGMSVCHNDLIHADLHGAVVIPHEIVENLPKAIDIILESIIETVALDEKVEIRGFGTFSKKYIRPRKFVNPKTKKVSYLGETATMHFKPSKSLIKK